MKDNKTLLIVIASLLVLSIVATGVLIFDRAGSRASSTNTIVNTISVSSSGSITVLPDVGYISLGVDTENADVKKAEDENSKIMNAIIMAMGKLGVEETDIKTTNYSIYPRYRDYEDEKPMSYTVNSTVQITVKNIEDISDVIDAAINAGANRTNNIRFDVLDRDASYNLALQDAIANAKSRAEVIADAAGVKIVSVVTVNENGSAPSVFYGERAKSVSMDMDESFAPAISTGDMEITASVSITYEVVNE